MVVPAATPLVRTSREGLGKDVVRFTAGELAAATGALTISVMRLGAFTSYHLDVQFAPPAAVLADDEQQVMQQVLPPGSVRVHLACSCYVTSPCQCMQRRPGSKPAACTSSVHPTLAASQCNLRLDMIRQDSLRHSMSKTTYMRTGLKILCAMWLRGQCMQMRVLSKPMMYGLCACLEECNV